MPDTTQLHLEGRQVVTPELAKQLLDHNTTNRPISRREVERLKRILVAGQWAYNGESVKLSQTGKLLDGQHRLIAIAESGVPAELRVEDELPDSVFATLDQGRKRTGGDVLFTEGVPRYNAVSTACGALYRILKNRPIYGSSDVIPAYGILDILHRHDKIKATAEFCAPLHRKGDAQVIGLGQLAAFTYVLDEVMGLPDKAHSFAEGLAVGTGLDEGSPILSFRAKVFAGRARKDIQHAQAKLALLAKVAGLHVSDTAVKYLTVPAPASAHYWALIPGLKDAVEKLGDKAALRDLPY